MAFHLWIKAIHFSQPLPVVIAHFLVEVKMLGEIFFGRGECLGETGSKKGNGSDN
jgi:hypothetical protein